MPGCINIPLGIYNCFIWSSQVFYLKFISTSPEPDIIRLKMECIEGKLIHLLKKINLEVVVYGKRYVY